MLTTNQNLPGLSKRGSTLNDGKSLNSDSYGESMSGSVESDNESESGIRGRKYEEEK